jgi:RNA polymerase sigma-70 factor (ECF subfamily)
MSLSQETDENLMLRFGRGEAAAFEFLYQRHESRVFRYLHRNVRNEASANDLMQEVWFAVVRGAAKYQPSAQPDGRHDSGQSPPAKLGCRR